MDCPTTVGPVTVATTIVALTTAAPKTAAPTTAAAITIATTTAATPAPLAYNTVFPCPSELYFRYIITDNCSEKIRFVTDAITAL